MPLDPFFRDRLRRHRRHLIGQLFASWRARFAVARPGPRSPGAAAPASGTPRAAARARHRRAALAWDRTELETVGTAGPDLVTEEHTVPVAGFPDVRVRLYRPPRPADSPPAPLFVSFYGGAFRIGGIDYPTTDAAARRRAAEADVVVAAVSYALAPEHPFPTAVEQGYAAVDWLVRHAAGLGVDPARVAVGGTSAGGCIAAAVALANRDRAGHRLALQLLEVPVTDLTGRHIDFAATWALGVPALVAAREMLSIARTYIAVRADRRHPLASPLRAASHADLPPALILTAEYDPLRRDGAAYGAALRRAGVEATTVRYLGVTHDVALYTGALPAARAWHSQIVARLRELHD